MISRVTALANTYRAIFLIAMICACVTEAGAAPITFTVTTNEAVLVTGPGTPRIAIDVGGVQNYASYQSGSGTATLTFAYQVQAGDFDPDGIAIPTAAIDLNGASITDLAGNPLNGLTFTPPPTTGLKVQTYTAAFTTTPVTSANANAVGISVGKAPPGASFTYTISSSGGGAVSGAGTIGGNNTASLTGINLSSLMTGTLTLSVQVSVTNQGQGQPVTATAAATADAGALDSLPATAAAYSVRRLRSAYTGPLLRVRRASDNVQQDIAATAWGHLDTATLLGFCGTGSCFVSAWYDQSGNGRHASQASASLQPRIVNGGAIETDGGRSSLFFTGLSSARLASGDVLLNFSSGTFAVVCRNMGTTTNVGGVIGTGNGGWGIYYDGDAADSLTGYVVDGYGANQGNSANTTGNNTNLVQLSAMYASANTTGTSLYMNGVLAEFFTAAGVAMNNVAAPVEIGGRTNGGFPARIFKGHISESLIFADALTNTARQALERDQGDYFSIAIP